MKNNIVNHSDNRFRGKAITWRGHTMNGRGWAKYFDVSPSTISGKVAEMGMPKAFDRLAAGKRQPRQGYVYSGPDFIAPNGVTIKNGTHYSLLIDWAIATGRNYYSILTRRKRLGLSQEAFNRIISEPISKVPHVIPGGGYFGAKKRKLKGAPDKPKAAAKPAKATTLEILQCRMNNPDLRCSPCRRRESCYGRTA